MAIEFRGITDDLWYYVGECGCGVSFRCLPSDLQTRSSSNFGAFDSVAYGIHCPACAKWIGANSEKHLAAKAKAKAEAEAKEQPAQ
jgi:hypothetical protein